MTKKLLIIVIILIILCVSLFIVLEKNSNNKKYFEYHNNEIPIIINIKELSLYDLNDFIFEEYFKFLNYSDFKYTYKFIDSKIIIIVKNNDEIYNFEFKYNIKEKEVIEKETIIYIEKNISDKKPNTSNITNNENKFFYLSQNSISFNQNENISNIIKCISNLLITNVESTIDYSEINPNVKGTYNAYFYSELGTLDLLVYVV